MHGLKDKKTAILKSDKAVSMMRGGYGPVSSRFRETPKIYIHDLYRMRIFAVKGNKPLSNYCKITLRQLHKFGATKGVPQGIAILDVAKATQRGERILHREFASNPDRHRKKALSNPRRCCSFSIWSHTCIVDKAART